MEKLYATQLGHTCKTLNEGVEEVVKKNEYLIYLGQAIELDFEIDEGTVFVDDIGRGGGPIFDLGEIYSAVQYMMVLALGGVVGGAAYDVFKKIYKSARVVFMKSKSKEKTFHFNVDVSDNSQFHFVFFSYLDKEDFDNAWGAIPNFVLSNDLVSNISADCYFDTKSQKWHIVGERKIDNEYSKKYNIY